MTAILLALFACSARPVRASIASVEPPPGWTDVSAGQSKRAVLAALKGPETSSFMLARMKPIDFDNRGEVRAYLVEVVDGINRATGQAFAIATDVKMADYGNGLSAQYVRADLNGKPRLIVAVARLDGVPMVAVLSSAVPETMLPEILGAVKIAAPEEADADASEDSDGPRVETEDGQLSLALPSGASLRPLTDLERKQGFMLAVDGWGSELVIMKIVDDTPVSMEPALVRATVSQMAGVDPGSVTRPAHLDTKARPAMVYSWGRLGESSQFAAGFLPWCYWGYSVLAKGPRAVALLQAVLPGIVGGSAAQPRLVAETPFIPLGRPWWSFFETRRGKAAGAGIAGLALTLLLLSRRRRIVVG